MAAFVTAVEQMQDFMRPHLGESAALSPERTPEAQVVAPCAARFVEGEMDPTRALAVARGFSVGPLGAPPSLAEKLGRKLAEASADTLGAVRMTVHKALAMGYLTIADTEENGDIGFHPERTTEDIWECWVPNCRTTLEELGVPNEWATTVRHMGADLVVGELKALRLTRFLGGSKINQLGYVYAQAGVHLRMVQTDNIPDELFRNSVQARRADPDRPWQFDDYAVEG